MTDELSEANEQGMVDPTFRELVDGGRWHELLALLSKRIDHDSKNVRLRCSRGRVLLRMHDCEAAVRDFSEAVRLDPKSVRAHLGRGDVYLELRQFDAALDEYDRAIALEPERGSTYWSRGVMYLERNRATDAIADFTKAADAAPGWALPYFWRAGARQEVGDFNGALSDYDVFLQLEREHLGLRAEAYGARAFIYKKLGLFQQSIAEYSRELQLNPGSATAYLGRAGVYELVGDQIQAEKDYKTAIEIDPHIADE